MKPAYDDYESVRAVLEGYVLGASVQDADLLESLFHDEAHMFGYLDGASRIVPIGNFLDRVRAQGRLATPVSGYAGQIVSIDIQLTAASATLLERNYNGRDFIDYFHLLKTDGRWRIVAKTFVHF